MVENSRLSIATLILDASWEVQLILLLLIAASVWSWKVIVDKLQDLQQTKEAADRFEDLFWSGKNLTELFHTFENSKSGGMAGIFVAGFREFVRLHKRTGLSSADVVDGASRAMRVALNRDLDQLEENLSFLATVGSTSPYIGLFGTVWGIMNSFSAIGATSNATLAMVAPGISEALVATAVGLFAAIPGVIFYNRFSNEIERLNNRYDIFLEEFSSILRRQSSYQEDELVEGEQGE
ncbi:MAG: protein TolQ [Gammaproteobacteria bacterium]|jgi:biopolymer transport protein TolQ|nr:protein TolQ [Gammaproteobacteria bacterium]MBT7308050.1 protein TolQ [Gammaproteobacteria bacterium]